MNFKALWLIARSVLIEAIRRKEIYAIVLVTVLLIGSVMTVRFFNDPGIVKFYRETALWLMSLATSITVIVLAARQLPREFQQRTIYPLLAKPIARPTFLLGKLLGVMLSAGFCFGLFMLVFVGGVKYLGQDLPWGLFLQFVYLQFILFLVLATLSFLLSMVLNLDAAITVALLYLLASSVITRVITFLYGYADPFGKVVLTIFNYAVPQLSVFDLSKKTVHAEGMWEPVGFSMMALVTGYGLFWVAVYFFLSYLAFRRRPL